MNNMQYLLTYSFNKTLLCMKNAQFLSFNGNKSLFELVH